MQVQAIARNARVSPDKVIPLVKKIKTMNPEEALVVLSFVPNSSSQILKKLISSAIANATNNNNVKDKSQMFFKEIQVGKGQVFKRFRAISRGRAHSILKRTSFIKIVLDQKEEPKKEIKEEQNAKMEGDQNGPKS